MRKARRNQYKMRLLELSERLARQVEELDLAIRGEREARGDLARLGTNADRDLEFLEVDEAIERNEVKLLNAVEAALARIEAGSYGYCEACGGEIATARLDAAPYTPLCDACERERTRLSGRSIE